MPCMHLCLAPYVTIISIVTLPPHPLIFSSDCFFFILLHISHTINEGGCLGRDIQRSKPYFAAPWSVPLSGRQRVDGGTQFSNLVLLHLNDTFRRLVLQAITKGVRGTKLVREVGNLLSAHLRQLEGCLQGGLQVDRFRLGQPQLLPQLVDFFNEHLVLPHDASDVLFVVLLRGVKLGPESARRVLEKFALTVGFSLHVFIHGRRVRDVLLAVRLVHGTHLIRQILGLRDELRRQLEIAANAQSRLLQGRNACLVGRVLLVGHTQFLFQGFHLQRQFGVLGIVRLQFFVHASNLGPHLLDFVFTGLNLLLQFLDFVVENKLELFELLVLLLQIVDTLLLVLNRLVPFRNLLLP
eukprot:m.22592 g.22592  ORF g.22592 m.22592 type:complete len:353 (+) comp4004_c0_seq1:189-1247(+)